MERQPQIVAIPAKIDHKCQQLVEENRARYEKFFSSQRQVEAALSLDQRCVLRDAAFQIAQQQLQLPSHVQSGISGPPGNEFTKATERYEYAISRLWNTCMWDPSPFTVLGSGNGNAPLEFSLAGRSWKMSSYSNLGTFLETGKKQGHEQPRNGKSKFNIYFGEEQNELSWREKIHYGGAFLAAMDFLAKRHGYAVSKLFMGNGDCPDSLLRYGTDAYRSKDKEALMKTVARICHRQPFMLKDELRRKLLQEPEWQPFFQPYEESTRVLEKNLRTIIDGEELLRCPNVGAFLDGLSKELTGKLFGEARKYIHYFPVPEHGNSEHIYCRYNRDIPFEQFVEDIAAVAQYFGMDSRVESGKGSDGAELQEGSVRINMRG